MFRIDLSPMGVGRLRAASNFSFESQYIKSTRERGSDEGTPYNLLYWKAPPERGTYFRYIKGMGFDELRYMEGKGNLLLGV